MKVSRIKTNLSDSARDFKDIVWPELESLIGGGKLVPVEGVVDVDFSKDLDILAGIDAWQVIIGQGMRGIGSRIQWCDAHNSFTVRYSLANGNETEYSKRLRAIQRRSEGYLYPHLTVQAYLTDRGGKLKSVAIVHTEELFNYLEELISTETIFMDNSSETFGIRRNFQDGSEFIFVKWSHLEDIGFQSLKIYYPSD